MKKVILNAKVDECRIEDLTKKDFILVVRNDGAYLVVKSIFSDHRSWMMYSLNDSFIEGNGVSYTIGVPNKDFDQLMYEIKWDKSVIEVLSFPSFFELMSYYVGTINE